MSGAGVGYDGRGNITALAGVGYGFNALNQLTSATVGGTTTGLSYDPADRLYQLGSTRFLYDGPQAIAEYGPGGDVLRRYVPGVGADQTVVAYEGAGYDRRWLQTDERGSVVAITDGSANALSINTYDEYGAPGPSNAGRFQYTGQMWLPEAQVYHYKARVYAPQLGRFLQTDPIGYDDGLNLYAYAANDPLNLTDPAGTFADVCTGGSCVWVDGDGDGSTRDDDLTAAQEARLARDLSGFIRRHNGADLAGNGKAVVGRGSSQSDVSMIRAISQFVGRAAAEEGGRFVQKWAEIDYIELRTDGGALAPMAGYGPDPRGNKGIVFTGTWRQGVTANSASDIARIMFHETGHVFGVPWIDNWVVHGAIDARACEMLGRYGLSGGGCVRGSWQACR